MIPIIVLSRPNARVNVSLVLINDFSNFSCVEGEVEEGLAYCLAPLRRDLASD